MFKPTTLAHLMQAMQTGATVEIGSMVGIISAIQREDGSGYNYNVTLTTYNLGLGKNQTEVVTKFIHVTA